MDYLLWDPLVQFQYKYYNFLVIPFAVIIPTLIPYYLFGESLFNSFFLCFILRYVYTLQLSLSGKSIRGDRFMQRITWIKF